MACLEADCNDMAVDIETVLALVEVAHMETWARCMAAEIANMGLVAVAFIIPLST